MSAALESHTPVMQQYLRLKAQHPGCAAVLSHGRLLRAVLRRREARGATARHHADGARPVGGPADSDGRRAVSQRRELSRRAWCAAANRSRSASRSAIRRKPKARSSARSCASSRRARSPTMRFSMNARDTLLAALYRRRREVRSRLARAVERSLQRARSDGDEALDERARTSASRRSADRRAADCRPASALYVRERPPWHFDLDSVHAPAVRAVRDARSRRLRLRRSSARDSRRRLPAAVRSRHAEGSAAAPARLAHSKSAATPCCSMRRRAAISSSISSLADRPECTVAAVLDHTATAMGGRELRRWLHRPLRDRTRRRIATAMRSARSSIRRCTTPLHDLLHHVGDIERGLARVALKSARPRDLAQLRDRARHACRNCSRCFAASTRRCCASSPRRPAPIPTSTRCSCARSCDSPPPILRDGGVIAAGLRRRTR